MFIYVDDIVICSNDIETHIELIEKVANKLVAAGLKANLDKSKFSQKQIRYLSYILDQDGLRADPNKIAAVVNYTAPRTLKELRRFIGMCSWYRRFIDNFSSLIAPMSELLNTPENNLLGIKFRNAKNIKKN